MGSRSYPFRRFAKDKVGVSINNEGPLHLHNVAFKNFRTNELNKQCGIKFEDRFRFGMGPSSSVKGWYVYFYMVSKSLLKKFTIS